MSGMTKVAMLGWLAAVALMCSCGPSPKSKHRGPAPTLLGISVTPSSATLVEGGDVVLHAVGQFSDGSQGAVVADWAASGPEVGLNAAVADSVVASALTYGIATVTATCGSLSAQVLLTIQPALVSVSVDPAGATIDVGETATFTAKANYSDGSQVDAAAVWWVSGPEITLDQSAGATISVTAASYGAATVYAYFESFTGQATVHIDPKLASLTVTPAAWTMTFQESVVMEVNGNYTDGSQVHVNATWTLSGPEASVVPGQGPIALLSGVSPGTVTATATFQGKSDSATIDVTPVFAVTPAFTVLGPGETLSVSATLDTGAGPAAVAADWTVSSGSVSLDTLSGGTVVATALTRGTAVLTAAFDGRSDDATISVATPLGPVYGNDVAGVAALPEDGGAFTWMGNPPGDRGYGMVMNGDQTALYVIGSSNPGDVANYRLYKLDLTAPQPAPYVEVADLSPCHVNGGNPYNGARGLEIDSQGRLYTFGNSNGVVLRYDPSTGLVDAPYPNINNVGGVGPGSIAFDSRDRLYVSPELVSGAQLIVRWNVIDFPGGSFVLPEDWATPPAGYTIPTVASGLAFNTIDAHDSALIMDSLDVNLYRFADVDGDDEITYEDPDNDGIFTPVPGEVTIFSVLPGSYGDGASYGITPVPGGVLLNRKQQTLAVQAPDPRLGIFWIVDANGDGDALDAGETGQYNPMFIFNGFDSGCLAAPRQ